MVDPLLRELGQASPLSEQQLEQVGGEASASINVPNPQLLEHTHTHSSNYVTVVQTPLRPWISYHLARNSVV